MSKTMQFSGDYSPTPLRALTPGSSYIGVSCRGCGLNVGICEDIAQSDPVAFEGDARFAIQCLNCGVDAVYGVSDLTQFVSAQGGAVSTS